MKMKEESEKAGLKLNVQNTEIMVSGPITSCQMDGETRETVTDFFFLGSKITADSDCSPEITRCLLLERKAMTNLDSILKSRDITLLTKVCLVNVMHREAWHAAVHGVAKSRTQRSKWTKLMVFPVVMYGCESWTIKKTALKNWSFWTVALEKTLERPLDCKEIQPVHPKGDQSWIFIGRTDTEAPILWPPEVKNWFLGKNPDAGKDQRQEEKGITEDEMVEWHHQLNGQEFEQALGVGNGQGSLAWCNPWACKESDVTEWLNWTEP